MKSMHIWKSGDGKTRSESLELIIAEQAEIIEKQADQIKRLSYALGQYEQILKGEQNEEGN